MDTPDFLEALLPIVAFLENFSLSKTDDGKPRHYYQKAGIYLRT